MTEQRNTDHISNETINAKLNALVQARVEDLEYRKEERERRDRERREDRHMMERMSSSVSEMAIAITEQTKENQHLSRRVDTLEVEINGEDGLERRTRKLENAQGQDGTKWKFVAGGIAAFLSIAGFMLTLSLWLADKVIEAIRMMWQGGMIP